MVCLLFEFVDVLELVYFEGLLFLEIVELVEILFGIVKFWMVCVLFVLCEGMGFEFVLKGLL